ncbi:hypothetical protein GE09DRAFT_319208 [Coniochaeta sp. 2T2.1]|nr:hypothetical protein GE09DRAFT_319208 [Coniochaeta sp. 2T2.1]
MASTQSLRSAFSCSACRSSALQLFVGSSLPLRMPRVIARTPSTRLPTACFSSFRPNSQQQKSPAIQELRVPGKQEGSVTQSEADGEEVPWYLQEEPPKHPTLIVEPPPLPDVPEGAPKVVEQLVKFTSDELGMEDIEIVDLRNLDPPPALGPGLLMLFGTARSDRHLHVSADRLVRWFRGRGISADADGLLGRNELKIRQKRNARKMKRLGHGYAQRENDDGISTQWVCVNAGTVSWVEGESAVVAEDGRVSGFGVPQVGSTVVVQMFTKSRRTELDLEGYWKKKLMGPKAARKLELEEEKEKDPVAWAIRQNATGKSNSQDRFLSKGPSF